MAFALQSSQSVMNIKTALTAPLTYVDVGQGRPVVLLHGFPLTHEMWRPQIPALTVEHRVIAPDVRGFGGSASFDGTPSIERMADDVAELLDNLLIDQPVALCGLSMGGYAALAFARKYPERLGALILADTRAEPDPPEGKAKRGEMIELAQQQGSGAVIEQMLPKLLGESTRQHRPEVADAVRALATAQKPESIMATLAALRDRPDAREWLPAINVPTLVIVGSEDTLTPPEMAQTLVDAIPNARLVTVDGAGHLSNLEQPVQFNQAVLGFLRSLP